MPALQVGKDVVGIARQSALGAPAAEPQFAHGIAGGGLSVAVNQEVDPLTSAHRAPAGAFRDKVEEGGDYTARPWEKSIGLYLLGALGGITSAPVLAPLAITSSSVANPTVITTTAPHGQGSTGTRQVVISGHTGSTPAINGSHTATMTGASTFTIPVNVSEGGTGGTVQFLVAPYEHVLTLDDATPYLTAFEKKGDGTIIAVQDCKVDELNLEWDENKPVVLGVKLVGTELSFPATFVPIVDEMDTADYFTPVGGTFTLDVDSETPVTAPLISGKIAIKRTAEAQFYSGDIEAGDVAEGSCDIEVGFTVVPETLADWRTIVTGAADGSSVLGEPVYGSFAMEFKRGDHGLLLVASRVAYLCDLPGGDPAGGPAKVELAGIVFRPETTPIMATLTNAHPTYAAEV